MPHDKLVEYMGVIGADKHFITLMIEGQTDGQAWRALISNADSSSVREDLEECIAAWTGEEFPLAHAMRIASHSKLAFQQWLEDKSSLTTTSTTKKLSLKDLHSIKLPTPPPGEGLDGRLNSQQLKAYIESIHSTLIIVDKEFSDRIMAVYTAPTLETLAICLQGMTALSLQLDQYVGGIYMRNPLEKTMATIISCKNHVNDDGTYSGLRVAYCGSGN